MVKYVVKKILPQFCPTFNGGICGVLRSNKGVSNISDSRTVLVFQLPKQALYQTEPRPGEYKVDIRKRVPKAGALPVAVPGVLVADKRLPRSPTAATRSGRLTPPQAALPSLPKLSHVRVNIKLILEDGCPKQALFLLRCPVFSLPTSGILAHRPQPLAQVA